jgi:hypothetical protein
VVKKGPPENVKTGNIGGGILVVLRVEGDPS